MDINIVINSVICVLSFVLALISVVTVIISLKQNSKMIEESTRPIIGIYGQSINSGTPMFYIVIRNFGKSTAHIIEFDYDFDFHGCYKLADIKRDYLKDLNGATLAPSQSKICMLDYKKITRPIMFSYEYVSGVGKTYKESMIVDLKAAVDLPNAVISSDNKEIRSINYTLQEMLKKSL